MAGDWIKMRADLFTHPKVVRMSSALKADTLRTVGGLMSVWCLFDAHSIDGHLDGYSAETLDSHLRWEGFFSAMSLVSWIKETENGLVLPDFETHNGQSAKRRAQDADRKKEVRKTSASDADKTRTREEKRREEKSNRNTATSVATPDGVSDALWTDFKKLRATKKAAVTQTAMDGIVREAAIAGLTISEALSMCCERGWTGFKADWTLQSNNVQPINKQTALEDRNRAVAQRWASSGMPPGAI